MVWLNLHLLKCIIHLNALTLQIILLVHKDWQDDGSENFDLILSDDFVGVVIHFIRLPFIYPPHLLTHPSIIT